MNFENNNNKAVKKLTDASLKSNRIRNIFAIIAIVLTTFMIFSVFSIGISFIQNYKTMQLRMEGNTSNVALSKVTPKQLEEIEKLGAFKSIGYEINVGKVDLLNSNNNKINVYMQYYSDEDWNKQIKPCISDVEGTYPTKENEIMMSRKALEFLGLNKAKIGDKINISYNIKDQGKSGDFILSGVYTNYTYTADTGYILVSKEFVDKNNLSLEKDGRLYMTVKNKYKRTIENTLKEKINLNSGQKFKFRGNLNEDSLKSSIKVIALVLIIVGFLVLSGYLLIYNVMYISVIKDINFYGLLKTIGTSPRQIRKIVKGQILKLSIVGISIGLILGAIVSFGIVPLAIKNFFDGTMAGTMPSEVSFNPIIFIGATLFSFLTVVLSCKKPAKIASTISPIEALRYIGSTPKKQRHIRMSNNGGKLYKMAWYNVFRDKKRAFIVFLSLFMGTLTFLSVSTFIKSIDINNYIKKYIKNDFQIEDNQLSEKLTDDDIESIKNMKGVTGVTSTKLAKMNIDLNNGVFIKIIKESLKKDGMNEEEINKVIESMKKNSNNSFTWIVGVTDKEIEDYNKNTKNKVNLKDFKDGKLALIKEPYVKENFYDYNELSGKSLVLQSMDKEEKGTFSMVIADDKEGVLTGWAIPTLPWMPVIYVSIDNLEKLNNKFVNYMVYIDVEPNYESSIKKQLESLTSVTGTWLSSKTEKIEGIKSMKMTINVLGGGISLILILIGLLNFINVMITGINARFKELAILESIGMTKKQIKKLLTYEGVYYAVITSVFILTIGLGVIYGVSILSKSIADYAIFTFPIIPLVILIIFIFLVCLITPSVVFKIGAKKTVTERLREIEN